METLSDTLTGKQADFSINILFCEDIISYKCPYITPWYIIACIIKLSANFFVLITLECPLSRHCLAQTYVSKFLNLNQGDETII